jgi:hypothetical protein
MSASITDTNSSPHRATWPLPGYSGRLVAVVKFIHDVFVEAQAMAREASRQHPHSE